MPIRRTLTNVLVTAVGRDILRSITSSAPAMRIRGLVMAAIKQLRAVLGDRTRPSGEDGEHGPFRGPLLAGLVG
jgi:hypothetical protein